MNMNIIRDQNLSTEEQALPCEIELTDADLEAIYGGQGDNDLTDLLVNDLTSGVTSQGKKTSSSLPSLSSVPDLGLLGKLF